MRGAWHRSPRAALSFLTALNALNYLDRYVIAATLPLIVAELQITDAQAGLLQSAFILSYSVVCPLMGWLGDRYSRTVVPAVGVLIWSAATLGSGLAPTYAILILARAITGIGEASYVVVTPPLLSDFYPAERRAFVLSVFYAAMPIGTALGYALGGVIGDAYGWRHAFLIAGAPGIVLAFLLMTVPEPPRGQRDPEGATGPRFTGIRPMLTELWSRPSYVVNTIAQILCTFAMGGLATWMPTYLVEHRGLSLTTAGTIFGLVLLTAGLLGTVLGGIVTDRVSQRWRGAAFAVSGLSLIASVPFTALAILAPSPLVYWPGMFVALVFLSVYTGPLNAAMANVLPVHLRSRGFAVTTALIHLLGDALSPWLVGFASDRVGLVIPVVVTGWLVVVPGLLLLPARSALDADMRALRSPAPKASPAI